MKMRLFGAIVIIAALESVGGAQAVISPTPKLYFTDNNGVPLAGCQVFTYLAGTSTPAATFTDFTGTTQNQNPVLCDSAGRASIWLSSTVTYKFVVQSAGGLSLYTVDGISGSGGGGGGSAGGWTVTGNNTSTSVSGNAGVGCLSPNAKLDVCGSSSGNNLLMRIDDASSSPGVNLYGGGIKLGTWAADGSSAFRVRAGNDATQLLVVQGGLMIQDQTASTGMTTLTVGAGAGQGLAPISDRHLVSIKSNAGVELAWFDSVGREVAPLYNADGAVGNASLFTFQNSDSTFLVDGVGDVTLSGQLHGVGNVQFDGNLNVTGTVTCGSGCSGGGGGGGFPVTDVTNIVKSNGDPTKLFKIDASTLIPTSTTITMKIPAANFTPVSEENPETIIGLKTFTADHVTANYWNAVNAGSSLVFNSANIQMDGNGNITANAAGATPGVTGGNVNAFGFVDTAIWFGMKPSALAPGVTPGGGYSALTYKGGASGLHIWLYDTVHTAWSDIDLGAVAGGITSLNGQTGPAITVAGTANQVSVVNTTNTITLSTPQSIAPASNVTFANVTTGVGGAFNSQAGTAGTSGFLLSNNKFIVDGVGDVSMTGQLNVIGTFTTGSCLSPSAICINSLPFVDTAVNVTAHNLTVTGTCTGCAGGSVGSITGTANQVLANNTSGVPQTGAVTLKLPQDVGTSSSVQFGNVVVTGAFNSTASGSSTAYTVTNGLGNPFTVDGNGNISARGAINMIGSYQQSGITIVDGAHNAFVNNLTISGICTGCSGGTVVTSLTGTPNRVTVSAASGAVTLSGPQDIGTASAVQFGSVVTSGAHNSTVAAGASTAYTVTNGLGNPFTVNGNGDISGNGSVNMIGATGLGAYRVNGTVVIDSARNASVSNLTISGTCTGCGGVSSLTGTGNQVLVNGTTGFPVAGAVTLALPQSICTACNLSFNSVALGNNLSVNGATVLTTAGFGVANESINTITVTQSGGTGINMPNNSIITISGGGGTTLITGISLVTGTVLATAFETTGGLLGVTGTTCTQFTNGICTHL